MKRIQPKNQSAYPRPSVYEEDSTQESSGIPLHRAHEEDSVQESGLHIPFIVLMKRIPSKSHPAYPLHSAYEEDSTQ